MPERIPIAIVSGFLGSGKTTLVQHLLADARAAGLRLAVVSNELGELGIDRALLARGDEDYIELAGGCVCCRLSDELQQSLEMLWRRVQPDRIVVETSGAALPFDVQLQLWRDPVRSFVSDDVTVVVIDRHRRRRDQPVVARSRAGGAAARSRAEPAGKVIATEIAERT